MLEAEANTKETGEFESVNRRPYNTIGDWNLKHKPHLTCLQKPYKTYLTSERWIYYIVAVSNFMKIQLLFKVTFGYYCNTEGDISINILWFIVVSRLAMNSLIQYSYKTNTCNQVRNSVKPEYISRFGFIINSWLAFCFWHCDKLSKLQA